MYYETVKTPSKSSPNLWIIKVNKKPEITFSAVHYMYEKKNKNKISIRKPLVDISPIQLFWFPFIVPFKKI